MLTAKEASMKFKTFESFLDSQPVSGYYWYFLTEYAIPTIGFYRSFGNKFYDLGMGDISENMSLYRIGGQIIIPEIDEVEWYKPLVRKHLRE